MYDKQYYPYPSTDKVHKYLIVTSTGRKVSCFGINQLFQKVTKILKKDFSKFI